MCNIHISTLYLGTFKTPEFSCCEMTQYQCSSLRKSTFPTKTDGEDGAQTGYAAQEHGGTVALLPAPAVQQNQTQGVGRELHHPRDQEVDVKVPAQVTRIERQPVIRHTDHHPIKIEQNCILLTLDR